MWIELNGAVNVRDVGGLPTSNGVKTRHGRLLRSDNLQGLTEDDVERLTGDIGVRDVVDLRTQAEVDLEGPGPLTQVPTVTIHHHSLFPEADGPARPGASVDGDAVLPWQGRVGRDEFAHFENRSIAYYLEYLYDRPDSVLSALRVIAHSEGAAVVHCAAGKDRTGVITALALDMVGVERAAIVDDYARTRERMDQILARLKASPTYASDLDGRPNDSHDARPETMQALLAHLDTDFGGSAGWLAENGWSADDTATLRERLIGR